MSTSSNSLSQQGGSDRTWILPQYANLQVLYDYEFGKQLGSGTFGVTSLVRDRTSAGPAACKSMCKGRIAGNQIQIEDIRREVAILEHLSGHSSVVNLRGVYEDTRQVHLVMDLCTGGDLHDFITTQITTRPHARLSEKDAAAVAKSMLEALSYCHGRGVIHRDVKPENFLLEKQGTVQTGVKVSDFGVSAWYKPGQVSTGCGKGEEGSTYWAQQLINQLFTTINRPC
jgi:calcium-dependent protein kinase